MNVAHLYDAGNYANETAVLGLTSSVMLGTESLGFSRPKDSEFSGHGTERFGVDV